MQRLTMDFKPFYWPFLQMVVLWKGILSTAIFIAVYIIMPNLVFADFNIHDEYSAAFVAAHSGDLTAIKKLNTGVEQGDMYAQTALGNLYETGSAVALDYSRAKILYEAAAAQDYAPAQDLLGLMYERGNGIPKDTSKAFVYFKKSAIQGYSDAQFHLGVLYCCADGEYKNYTEGAKWLWQAAKQGHGLAAQFLAELYQEGKGISRDYEKAYFWFRIANLRSGEIDAEKKAVEIRKYLESGQIDRLDKRIKDWKPKQIWRSNLSKK